MSTILKALKKLEQEQEGQRSDIQRPGTDLITRQVFSKTVRFAWLRRIGLLWFLVLLVASIGGVGIYLIGKDKGIVIRKNISKHQTSPTEEPPADLIDGRTGAPLATPSAKSASNSSVSDQPRRTLADPTPKDLAQPPKTGVITADREPFEHAAPPLAENLKTSSPRPEKTPVPEITAPATTSHLGAKPMTDGRLNVQAIAWSPVAEERVAVVNDRIVHQGDVVDGFIVLAVEPDQIVVRSNGQTWSVPFGQGKSGN